MRTCPGTGTGRPIVYWCDKCGVYTTSRTKGLADKCEPKHPPTTQMSKLRKGIYPLFREGRGEGGINAKWIVEAGGDGRDASRVTTVQWQEWLEAEERREW